MSVSKWAYQPSKCDGNPCPGDCDLCSRRDESVEYRYGMRLRGFSIGCQPRDGFIDREDDPSGRYYDILVYERQLTKKELEDFELDFISEEGSR